MHYYPVFLNLSHASCLIVGAGSVGCRKIATLLKSQPRELRVVDALPPRPELIPLLADERVHFRQGTFAPTDLAGCMLAFAATSHRETNAAVVKACAERGIACNCADDPDAATFIVPAQTTRGDITIALSTGGGSPALARKLRLELDAWLESHQTAFVALNKVLTRLRPLVLALRHETGQNTLLFRSIVDSPLSEALSRQDRDTCETVLRGVLPSELHLHITELLHDLV